LQNNTISTESTKGEYFSHFSIIRYNPFGEKFEAFGGNNNNNINLLSENNNSNNLPLLLSLSKFEGELEEGFNLPPEGNLGRLDPNVVALVNILTGANLRMNHIEKESNHVKLIEFRKTEAENPNE